MAYLRSGRTDLVEEARRLQKATLFASAWIGRRPTQVELAAQDFESWKKLALREYVTDVRHNLRELCRYILEPSRAGLPFEFDAWLALQFDQWQAAGGGLRSLGTAGEFERQFGRLVFRQIGEVPPYAELLLQGWHGLAIRHPEYMLARDLELAYSFFRQADYLLIKADGPNPPQWAKDGSEAHQALARMTVQACFNLLEAFVSGLGRLVAIQPEIDEKTRARLLDNGKSLRARTAFVASTASKGAMLLNDADDDFRVLFTDIKRRRDTFVHCEPGPQQDAHGTVKEILFHDVSAALVQQAAERTDRLIRRVWRASFAVDGPRWLTDLAPSRIPVRGFRLSRAEDE